MGKGGKRFDMYKFRSMCVDAEERLAELRELNEKSGPVFKIADDPRITRVGRVIRKLSLDELPQFFSVLACKREECVSNTVYLLEGNCYLKLAGGVIVFVLKVPRGSGQHLRLTKPG